MWSARSCLQIVKENSLKSIAFQVINSEKRGYPPDNGAHIAIRTVRRFLERFSTSVDLIVFCMDRDEDIGAFDTALRRMSIHLRVPWLARSISGSKRYSYLGAVLYSGILPMYFPRSEEEETKMAPLLPEDTGNELGETVIEERKIRINATVTASGAFPFELVLEFLLLCTLTRTLFLCTKFVTSGWGFGE